MTCKCARFDASGNRILPHPGMKIYYSNDKQSLELLSKNMPHRLVVIPDVEIRIVTKDPVIALLYLIYPGETKERTVHLSDRNLAYLRKLYCRKSHWTIDRSKPDRIIFRRKGRVILDPLKRFGVWTKRA